MQPNNRLGFSSDLNEYQQWVSGNGHMRPNGEPPQVDPELVHVRPAILDELCAGLGLAGEAGECADLVKKNLLHGAPKNHAKMREELGDVLWYWVMVAARYGFTPQKILDANVEKLCKRYPPSGQFSTAASIARADEKPAVSPPAVQTLQFERDLDPGEPGDAAYTITLDRPTPAPDAMSPRFYTDRGGI